MRRIIQNVLLAVGVSIPSAALACAWDYDTLRQERSRVPDTLEIITGKFLRHSTEFYEWRIRDRQQKLATDPDNLPYYDDLAVAFDKTGQHDKAIKTILKKDKIKPGLYETEANLGTFLFHAGRFQESVVRIDAAIHINPDAHFGREKYQLSLTKYVLKHGKGKKLPVADSPPEFEQRGFGFAAFLTTSNNPFLSESERLSAIKGVSGMMRFARHDSPLLLEVLANLLVDAPKESAGYDAKRLAARSYLKASYEVKDDVWRSSYRELARWVLRGQTRHPHNPPPPGMLGLEEVEQDF